MAQIDCLHWQVASCLLFMSEHIVSFFVKSHSLTMQIYIYIYVLIIVLSAAEWMDSWVVLMYRKNNECSLLKVDEEALAIRWCADDSCVWIHMRSVMISSQAGFSMRKQKLEESWIVGLPVEVLLVNLSIQLSTILDKQDSKIEWTK